MRRVDYGDCYNQVLQCRYDGELLEYNTVMEPLEAAVLDILASPFTPTSTPLQYVNYYLLKTDKGFIMEFGDSINILPQFKTTYLDFVEWIKQEYLNKHFSWQSVEEGLQ
jgi:hypothetical protein